MKAICERHQIGQSCDDPDILHPSVTLVESLTVDVDALPHAFQRDDAYQITEIPQLSEESLRERQRTDPEVGIVIQQLESKEKPSLKTIPPELIPWFKEWNRLELRNGILFRRRQEHEDSSYQLALPADLRDMVLKELHDEMGHMGIERTPDLVRSRFFWPKMSLAVEIKTNLRALCSTKDSARESCSTGEHQNKQTAGVSLYGFLVTRARPK